MTRFVLLVGLVAALSSMACGGGKGALTAGTGGAVAKGTGGAQSGSGEGGGSGCTTGNERCACYANGTCNAGLTCASQICVALGGGTGGNANTGTGGNANTGTGGNANTGTGGNAATGTGGNAATGTGGNATTGTGGNATTGTGGNTTAGTGGNATTGTGGNATTGTGGNTTMGTGGSNAGTGGMPGTGGSTSATLVFNAGFVAADKNTFGVQGSIYTFSDGAGSTISPDCTPGTGTCYGALTGTGPICTQGDGAVVPTNTGTDYGIYWGAALGMDLNNPDTVAAEFPATQKGILGFKFDLTTAAVPSGVKVRFTYQVHDAVSGNLIGYCVDLNPGTNAIYFSNARQNCYQAGGTVLSAATADHLEHLQWQVPTRYGVDTPFTFCIDKITPLTQ